MAEKYVLPFPPAPLPSKGEGRREGFSSATETVKESPSPSGGRGVGERERAARLLQYAKTMRSRPTDAEQRLWFHLRAKRFMGLKFKRQKPIGPYIADFVFLERKLIIEADGGQHGSTADQRRDAWFEKRGFTILRFWNHEILGDTRAVLERIRQVVGTLSSPSPTSGRGEKAKPDRWGEKS